MSDYDTDDREDFDFSAEPREYLYEPEYTDAEIRQMEFEERERGGTEKSYKLKLEKQLEP